jgi:hypothetical protein
MSDVVHASQHDLAQRRKDDEDGVQVVPPRAVVASSRRRTSTTMPALPDAVCKDCLLNAMEQGAPETLV